MPIAPTDEDDGNDNTSIASKIAYATMVVYMNTPPTNGIFVAVPSRGAALDSFTLSTSYWTDDVSDLPLEYTFSYYSLRAQDMVLVKGRDQRTFASVFVAQGLFTREYLVTCVVHATDVYEGTANATTAITILPAANSESVLSITLAALSSVSSSSNGDTVTTTTEQAELINQVVSVAVEALNTVDCSAMLTETCSSQFNREPCSSTANTCGPCLAGFLGVSGAANTPCLLQGEAKRLPLVALKIVPERLFVSTRGIS